MKTDELLLCARAIRPPFLLLTLSCLFMAVALAYSTSTREIAGSDVILIVIAGIAAHISVNAFNEYFDFTSGLDQLTTKTPFSGGSGLLPAHPHLAQHVFKIATASLCVCILIGIYMTIMHGMLVLIIGIVGVLLIVTYTHLITRSPLMSLIAPGIAFGPIMISASLLILVEEITLSAMLASLLPFFLVNNLLLLNQFPDIDADKQVGRRNYPITIGRRNSSLIYLLFVSAGYAVIPIGIVSGYFPALSIIASLGLLPALIAAKASFCCADDIALLSTAMKLNVSVCLVTPIALGASFLLSGHTA